MSGMQARGPNRRSTRVGGVAAVGVLALALFGQLIPVQAASRHKTDFRCPQGGVVAASSLPASVSTRRCDLVGKVLTEGSVAVVIPGPGRGVSVAALGSAGETSLDVFHSADGVITIYDEVYDATESFRAGDDRPPPCDELDIDGCIPPCSDNTYVLNPDNAKEKKGQPWYFKASSTPTGGTPALTVDKALTHIKAGTKTIVTGRNDCGLGDPVPDSQGAPYKGTTTQGSGITITPAGEAKCAPANGKNIVDFGNLPGPAGLACTYTASIDDGPVFIPEADIRFEKDVAWTTTPGAEDCFNLLDLQSVAAHERGHAYGLKHAGESGDESHFPQTMFYTSYVCSSYQRTLGKGDHSGLKALY